MELGVQHRSSPAWHGTFQAGDEQLCCAAPHLGRILRDRRDRGIELPSLGFSPTGAAAPWLPLPSDWKRYAVTALEGEPGSILNLYRRALTLRCELRALGAGTMAWLDPPEQALLFERPPGFLCLTNLSPQPIDRPANTRVLLASTPLAEAGSVPTDTTVWLATDA